MIAPDWMAEQLWQLGIAVVSGLILGILYDCYRGILARKRRRSRRSYFFRDLCFGLLAILLALLLWFGLTDGSLRLSVLLWMLGGALFYAWLLSPFLGIYKYFVGRGAANRPTRSYFRRRRFHRRHWNVVLARRVLKYRMRLRQRFVQKPTEEENEET